MGVVMLLKIGYACGTKSRRRIFRQVNDTCNLGALDQPSISRVLATCDVIIHNSEFCELATITGQ